MDRKFYIGKGNSRGNVEKFHALTIAQRIGNGDQAHAAAMDHRDDAIAVELDLVQPLLAGRSVIDAGAELRFDEIRHFHGAGDDRHRGGCRPSGASQSARVLLPRSAQRPARQLRRLLADVRGELQLLPA